MRRIIIAIALVALPLLTSATGWAQPKPGDYVAGRINDHFLYAVDSQTGAVTTVAAVALTNDFVNWVTMDYDNEAMVTVTGNQADLQRVTPGGAVTSIARVSTMSLTGLTLDETGDYAVTASDSRNRSQFLAVTGSGAVSTIAPVPNFANGVAIDLRTGAYLIAMWNGSTTLGGLASVDRATGAVTTLAASAGPLGRVSAVDYAASTDQYVVSSFGPSAIHILDANGRLTSFGVSGIDHAVKVDDVTGIIHAAGFQGMAQYDFLGNRIRTVGPTTHRWTSLEIYGSSNVSGAGVARPGSTYACFFSFPVSGPGASYVAVLSLSGTAPGIPVAGGRTISIIPDSIAIFMAQNGDIPGVTQGFTGTLGPNGLAIGSVRVPNGTPPGVRVFVTAVALNPAMPAGVETGNTWAFTTQ